jgi:hypothetical protein
MSSVKLVVESMQLRPLVGKVVVESVIVPLKLFRDESVIVAVPVVVVVMFTMLVLGVTLKSAPVRTYCSVVMLCVVSFCPMIGTTRAVTG